MEMPTRREIIAAYLRGFKVHGITKPSLREIIAGVKHIEEMLKM